MSETTVERITTFEPAMSWRGTREFASPWRDEVTNWFGSVSPRLASLTPSAWLLMLIPSVIDERLQAPDSALQTYQQVSWTQAPPIDCQIHLEVTPSWVASREAHTEVGLRTDARLQGRVIARGVSAVRHEGHMPTWGERGVRSKPGEHRSSFDCDVVFSPRSVKRFGELIDVYHRIHTDVSYAETHGFDGVLVQGLALAAVAMAVAGTADRGHAEFWFRRPLVADRDVRIAVADMASEKCVTAATLGGICMVGRIAERASGASR
jgi:hypothetical protein